MFAARLAYGLLLARCNRTSRLVAHIFGAVRKNGATMNAVQRPVFAKLVQVLADRLRGDGKACCQVLDKHASFRFCKLYDLGLTRAEKHRMAP